MRDDRGGNRVVVAGRDAGALRARVGGLAVGALLLLSLACATVRQTGDPEDAVGPTRVLVENQGFVDMNIFAYRSTQRTRLGMAGGNSKTTLTIPASLLFGPTTLRFVAEPIGGTRASVSMDTAVTPGDLVTITIPPN